jgi:phage tail-like protein
VFASGLGAARHIAIDCEDNVYVVVEGQPDTIHAFDASGKPVHVVDLPEALAARFPSLPFTVDAAGNLDLAALCARAFCAPQPDQNTRTYRFDRRGNPLKDTNVRPGAVELYEKTGTYQSTPLDSQLYRCQWHRVILRGQLPAGTRVTVYTYTSETDQATVPPDAWETQQTAYETTKEGWDCLVRNSGGRYLWLRLELQGNGVATPGIESVQVEFPRLSLRRYLPAVFGVDPISADFTDRFLSIFDTTLRSIEDQIDTQAGLFDPHSAPVEPGRDFLSWLASWVGLTSDRRLPVEKRRQMVARAARLHHLRGTREGLWRQLLLFLGFQPNAVCCAADQPRRRCQAEPANCAPPETKPCAWQAPPLILEHFQLRRWLFLGAGRLGDQSELWGRRIVSRSQLAENAQVEHSRLIATQNPHRDPFHVYAHKFSVFVPGRYGRSESDRRALNNLVRLNMPVHTQVNLEWVEPRFRIGFQASIGLNTVVGRYPAGVTLNETALGGGSVLNRLPNQPTPPSFSVGKTARVGSSTRLD